VTVIERTTQQSSTSASLRLLQSNLSRMSRLQTELSSGKAFTRPSEDPAGTVDAMRIRAEQRANAQYARNAADGVGWLSAIDNALTTSTALLRRARDLTVEGANTGALGAASREALAAELDSTAEALREQANTKYLSRSVFAGTSDAVAAFDAGGVHQGVAGAGVERRVAEAATVRVDSDGAAVFGDGAGSVFALLHQIATDLRAGNDVIGHLDALDARMTTLLSELADVGTRYRQLEIAQEGIDSRAVTLSAQLSGVEDADLAETIADLKLQEVAYAASLSATERVLQPSLLDFLR
jgi:flagellar hook-associated protein 3 FlgL